ncbi:MAG TPA: hypothetical protein VK735_16770 [Pseudonocardia sp.]|jgi:hypothetical protein|uniref:hypothetical protein n=1 Tax=Pseudonocardia sp. TaxID=60912 RepID=UPI002B7691C3|nr:hypothetical protein [Pseudonocardia sp.]HTF49100.1 hypothetical protein [Pseudonocardia sp.]
MPIRTPKGRGAAYRPLWQWPLRSPARLIGCLVVLVALVIVANSAFGLLSGRTGGTPGIFSGGSTQPTSAATPTAEAAPAEPTRLPPVPELTPRTLPPSQAPRAALAAAIRWTEAWARHPAGTTTQSWVTALRPYTTDEYLGVLSTVDPSNVPATRVTGPARAVLVSPHSVRVEVPTDAVTLVVLVVNTAGTEWKVAGYDRAVDDPNAVVQQPAGEPAPGR